MKRIVSFLILPFFLGLCGAFLRATELSYSFEAQTGLHINHLSATPVLMILSCAALLLFFALSLRTKSDPEPQAASPVFSIASALAALVLLASAAVQIYQCVAIGFSVTTLVQALLSVYTATALLALAKNGLARSNGGAYAVFAVAPVFWMCFTLILIYRDRIADPILLDYTYLLFAGICALLFFYALAGYVFGKNKLRLIVLFGSLSTFFCMVELLGHVIAAVLPVSNAGFSISPLEALTLLMCLIFIPFAQNEVLKNRNEVK